MTYTPSKYWTLLNSRANEFLDKYGYENFKRTIGLFLYNDYFYDYDKQSLSQDYNDKVRAIWDKLYSIYPDKFLDQFYEPLEGNPLAIEYRGRLVSLDLVATISEYTRLSQYIDFNDVNIIHEIGGGYGRIPFILTKLYPNLTYRMFDVEPSLSLAKRYLGNVIPGHPVTFHPPNELKGQCDILLAMDCLHEMTKDQVESYFDYADKHASYFYYSCWKETHINEDGIDWAMDDYPVRESWSPLYVGQHHMRAAFFEALYKCR